MSGAQAPTFFISDLHLEASRTSATEAFRNFVTNTARGAKAIYILGDFFNSWIGDDDNSHFILSIKKLLADTCKKGTVLYFMHGNRDFLIGHKFAAETGVILLPENTVIDLYGESVLLLHGDSLCTDDAAYQTFRRRVRSPKWQKKVLRYPLFIRRLMANYFRFKSRTAKSNKAENIMDVAPQAVTGAFRQFNVQKIIHGHTHRPKRHHIDRDGAHYERIVLGDWESKGWYLKADDKNLELVAFPIQQSLSCFTE